MLFLTRENNMHRAKDLESVHKCAKDASIDSWACIVTRLSNIMILNRF